MLENTESIVNCKNDSSEVQDVPTKNCEVPSDTNLDGCRKSQEVMKRSNYRLDDSKAMEKKLEFTNQKLGIHIDSSRGSALYDC